MNIRNRMEARKGDITRLAVDAIVNAANTSLRGGGGVDGAIHRAAGPELLAECKTLGGCPTGEARLTRGYRLPAKHVIHTVGPVYHGHPRDARLLAGCYSSSLEIASTRKFSSLAFPVISCGVYGYPVEDACKIAVDTCSAFLNRQAFPETVLFMLFSDADLDVYRRRLDRMPP